MRKYIALGLGLLFCGVALSTGAGAAEPTNTTSILFIGNSFTYVNDLPAMITKLAQTGGQKPLVCARETPGGCTFEKHWQGGRALAAINSRKWDFVVLQEESRRPSKKKDLMFEYARKLDAAIKNQGAKTLLYMTWAWPTPDAQPAITAAYQELAKELHARLVPVGIGWSAALHDHPEIDLFAKDHHHPSPAGTYLAACAFYAAIYGRSPVGLSAKIKGVTDTEAASLQKRAWAAVQERPGK
ncbi:MAG: SGNH/GDSL hydrolase family protein [Kiritimatiellaeota bacterium]|nr:SGNH/GDSL hydrolase family protein [Kiritimatiellota bacterium]